MVEPWRTLREILADALARVRSASSSEQELAFAPAYDRVFESLTRAELYGDSISLLEEDLAGDLFHRERRSKHFLDFYSQEGAVLAFERYGFFQLLRNKGFEPILDVDLADRDEHKLRIYDRVVRADHLLIELGVGRRTLPLPDGASLQLLFINWLLMQNPRASFTPDRPPLPDQEHPGLGLFPHFGYLVRLMALRLKCDGLLNHPAHYHNAQLYGRFFHFVDPIREGCFRALERDLASLSLAEATRAVDEGRVVDTDGLPVEWKPAPQVAPITNRARAWFATDAYQAEVQRTLEATRHRVV